MARFSHGARQTVPMLIETAMPPVFQCCGLPLELCVDYHSLFFNSAPEALTQLGAAGEAHGVAVGPALSVVVVRVESAHERARGRGWSRTGRGGSDSAGGCAADACHSVAASRRTPQRLGPATRSKD